MSSELQFRRLYATVNRFEEVLAHWRLSPDEDVNNQVLAFIDAVNSHLKNTVKREDYELKKVYTMIWFIRGKGGLEVTLVKKEQDDTCLRNL